MFEPGVWVCVKCNRTKSLSLTRMFFAVIAVFGHRGDYVVCHHCKNAA